jgi:DNA-directed RNA polymerase subunit beta'
MGHIELAAPVSHIWYFKGIPSRMGLILDISPRILEKLLYFACYIVTDPGFTPLQKNQILTEKEYRDYREKYENDFKAGMGAEAVKELLSQRDCEKLSAELKAELKEATGQKKAKLVSDLRLWKPSGYRQQSCLDDNRCAPVIPPDLRPMVQLEAAGLPPPTKTTSTQSYQQNNRLKKLIQLKTPTL